MKINQLRYFLAVADKGSVRAAATALEVSAAAVSQALRELETAMGTPLLKRESHGAVLSYAGRQFLIHARLILGQVSRAEAEIAQIRGATGGTLTIGVTPWVAQSILPHALARFHALRPDVHLDVTEAVGTVHPLLRDGTLALYGARDAVLQALQGQRPRDGKAHDTRTNHHTINSIRHRSALQ